MFSDHYNNLHRSSLLNLTVNSDLAPSVDNVTIFLIIGPSRYHFLNLIHVTQNIVYEDGIQKFHPIPGQ